MKNSLKNIYRFSKVALAIALLAASTSCGKDFLDRNSELDIPEEQISAEALRVEGQVNGLYASLKNGALYGGRYLIYNDIRGEEFLNRGGNNVTGYSVYQFSNDPSDSYVAGFWIQAYVTINRVNIFLDNISKVSDDIVPAEKKAQYISEAKFIRAISYYTLVQLFAKPYAADNGASQGVPLRLTPEKSVDNNAAQRATVKAIYDQILKDLNEAEPTAVANYGDAYRRGTRVHKNTVIALKTRVYLAMKNFPKVIEEANKIVSPNAPFAATSGVPHKLLEKIESVFADKTSDERILSFPFELTNIPGTQNQLSYYYNMGNIEYYLNKGTTGIYANPNWPETDARKSALTGVASGFTILKKYTDVGTYLDWVPAIRYAEVLLNLAEAEAEVGDQGRALALLKAIRNRSDAAYTFPAFASRSALVDAILLERRIELLGEGFRAPDLQRRNSPINSVGAGRLVQPNDDHYVFPIPLRELIDNVDINK
ncbi:RagB/SusD family nutrient uptake outer membrane protein [Sphingobacterium lactis]|uniref:RagB/SusD family nutrient uptake outer membrane protein n=1 Tax=Sphingobacterium lactis TaxID=797291 RepID=UPI003EC64650